MTLPTFYTPLHERLSATGHVVVAERDHLEVRLPIMASVRVSVGAGDTMRCEPRFDGLGRTTAFALNIMLMLVLAAAMYLATGPGIGTYIIGLGAVLGTLYDFARFVVTEHTITRIHMLWQPAQLRDPGRSVTPHA